MDLQIRPGRLSDVGQIVALYPAAAAREGRVVAIRGLITTQAVTVADEGGHVRGLGVLEYTFFRHGFISLLFVAPGHRRRGIGSKLLLAMEQLCKTPKLFTSTNRSNQPMQSLLAKLGYEPSGVIENLDEGDSELVYFKRVARPVLEYVKTSATAPARH